MPRIRRHRPGQYKEKEPIQPNFTGVKPLTLFEDEKTGFWGAKAGDGTIEIPAVYKLAPQTDYEKRHNIHRLIGKFEVLQVSPDDWDVIFFYSPD